MIQILDPTLILITRNLKVGSSRTIVRPSLPGYSGSLFPIKEFGGLYQFPSTFLQTYKVYCLCQNKPAKCSKIESTYI